MRHYLSPLVGIILTLSAVAEVSASKPWQRTVLLTLDGASDEIVDKLIEQGEFDARGFIEKSRKSGLRADELVPINVASTGPSHVAIFSGATPEVSGVVGQSFTSRKDPMPKGTDAFAYVSDAETIVATAHQQGKRTACIAAPGFDGRTPNYTCDYMLGFVQSAQDSLLIQFEPVSNESQANTNAASPKSAGKLLKVKSSASSLPTAITNSGFSLSLIDNKMNDDVPFDTVQIHLPDGTQHKLPMDRIFPFQRYENGTLVTNALWLNRFDPATGQVDLYWGQPYQTVANAPMMKAVIEQLGAWPGTLDARGFHAGRINGAGFDALNDYQAKYSVEAVALLLKQNDWDLLIGYIPYLDTVKHEYLVTSPLQLDYASKSARYSEKVNEAYVKLDRWLGEIPGQASAAGTNFVIASDHGMVPTHTAVAISGLIESWGYSVQTSDPDVGIFTSGASAHIYINNRDESVGGVSAVRKRQIIDDMFQKFRALKDPTDRNVFTIVKTKEQLSELELGNQETSGDLFISAAAGFSLDTRRPPTSRIFLPISFDRKILQDAGLTTAEVEHVAGSFFNRGSPGAHGHVAGTEGIAAILYGLGPNIAKVKVGRIHSLQIAPSIACLLGIAAPTTARAPAVTGFCK